MNYNIGDRVEIVNCPWWHYCGAIATLVEPHNVAHRWILDLPPASPAISTVCGEEYFKRIPDTYDGNNASTWDQCDFKPAIPVEVES